MSFSFTSFSSLGVVASAETARADMRSDKRSDKVKDSVKTPSEVPDKIAIDQADLVYFDTDYGRVILQITDIQSPKAALQFKSLVNEGYYDGLDFYRVIEANMAMIIKNPKSLISAQHSKPNLPHKLLNIRIFIRFKNLNF